MSVLFYIVLCLIVILVGAKLYVKLYTGWNNSYTCLVGKTAIVTGSNTGIGYHTALDFAKRGARVILACRNGNKAEEAKNKIIAATGNHNVVVRLIDFHSFESVRDFCDNINRTEEHVNILVNNAGIGGVQNTSKTNVHPTWHVNHFSPFLLTHLLIGKLKQSTPSRIVMVSSCLSKSGKADLKTIDANNRKFVTQGLHYNNTKQANILFTRVLAERLKGSGVNVYTLHPGAVHTDIFKGLRWNPLTLKVAYYIINMFFKTPEEGAQTSLYCSLSTDLNNSSGKLYEECKEIKMYESCSDMKVAELLWEKSEEVVGLQSHEKL